MGYNFQELVVWQKSVEFYAKLIPLLKNFQNYERNCLIPQITRAALSISNNIAEGSRRESNKNLKYFYTLHSEAQKKSKTC